MVKTCQTLRELALVLLLGIGNESVAQLIKVRGMFILSIETLGYSYIPSTGFICFLFFSRGILNFNVFLYMRDA
jgi:hypothetical protein